MMHSCERLRKRLAFSKRGRIHASNRAHRRLRGATAAGSVVLER